MFLSSFPINRLLLKVLPCSAFIRRSSSSKVLQLMLLLLLPLLLLESAVRRGAAVRLRRQTPRSSLRHHDLGKKSNAGISFQLMVQKTLTLPPAN